MKLFKTLLFALSLSLLPLNLAALTTASALGANPSVVADSHQDACNGLNQVGGTGCGGGQAGITNILSGVVTIISYIAGIIAVIMIIVSGMRYMTSGGDSTKVSAAKTALIYALIGLAVTGLTQILIHLVLSTAVGDS
ncbi:MAG TPA: pilin [Candidatus Saccharimonadales bacterium]|nr:pilin [Candidatus Saccharimonadales bacterium]